MWTVRPLSETHIRFRCDLKKLICMEGRRKCLPGSLALVRRCTEYSALGCLHRSAPAKAQAPGISRMPTVCWRHRPSQARSKRQMWFQPRPRWPHHRDGGSSHWFLKKRRELHSRGSNKIPGEADPKGKAYHAKLKERTEHLKERWKSKLGTESHLEHSINGRQGLVVGGEGEVAEASLEVDDQVGGAVERERGVTREKRQPEKDRSSHYCGIGVFRATFWQASWTSIVDTYLASWSWLWVVSPFNRPRHTVCSSSTTNLK